MKITNENIHDFVELSLSMTEGLNIYLKEKVYNNLESSKLDDKEKDKMIDAIKYNFSMVFFIDCFLSDSGEDFYQKLIEKLEFEYKNVKLN